MISAVSKLISYKAFLQFVVNFHLFPRRISLIIGSLIPYVELMGAALLLLEPTRSKGAIILLSLLTMFSYAVTQVLRSKRRITCGCYGRLIDATVDRFTIGKIVYFFLVTIIIGFIKPLQNAEISALTIVIGTSLSFLVFVLQIMWQRYRETLDRLRKIK